MPGLKECCPSSSSGKDRWEATKRYCFGSNERNTLILSCFSSMIFSPRAVKIPFSSRLPGLSTLWLYLSRTVELTILFSLFLKITFFFCRNVKKHFSKRIVRVGDLCISCIPVFWNCLYLINNNQKIACPLADTNLPSCVNYTSHEWAMRASDRYNQHSCFQHC